MEKSRKELIKEVKSKGFRKGIYVKGLSTYSGRLSGKRVMGKKFLYIAFNGGIYMNLSVSENVCIFKDGIWATIVEETITRKEAEKELTKIVSNLISGYGGTKEKVASMVRLIPKEKAEKELGKTIID